MQQDRRETGAPSVTDTAPVAPTPVRSARAGHPRPSAVEPAARRVRAVLDASPNAILLVDLDGRIRFANEQVRHVLGYRPDALAGQMVELLVPDARRAAHVPVRAAFVREGRDRGLGVQTNLAARRMDGSVFPVDIALGMIELDDGPGLVVTVIDVEARQLLEARLLQAQKMELMGRFANMLAHDMRNYLNAIAGLAEVADHGRHDGAPGDELVMIGQVVRRADEAITNILGIGRPRGASTEGTDIAQLLEGSRRVLEHLAMPSCGVIIDVAESLPAVAMDAGALSQVLMNLVTNARDAMPGGGRIAIIAGPTSLAGSAEAGRGSEPAVSIAVQDTGVGMDEATRSRIFEPFFSTKQSSGGGSGSGLGLASVEMLVSRARGRICVDSTPGSGSRFEIVLPLALAAG